MVHNNIGDAKPQSAKLTNGATPTDGTYAEINLKRSTAVSTPPGQVVNMNENSASSPSQDGKNVEVVYAAVDKSAKRKKVRLFIVLFIPFTIHSFIHSFY